MPKREPIQRPLSGSCSSAVMASRGPVVSVSSAVRQRHEAALLGVEARKPALSVPTHSLPASSCASAETKFEGRL
jgi:hypothetical protein